MALQHDGSAADPQRLTLFQAAQPGIIIAAHIRCTSQLREPYAVYAQCGVSTDDASLPINTKVVFVEGYVSLDRPLSWTGLYVMHPDDQFYLVLTGDLTQAVEADIRRLPNIATKTLEELFAAVIPST